MTASEVRLRAARKADAAALARLVDFAGEGLPAYLWTQMGGGADPFEIGRQRAERDEGAFSWRNAVVAEAAGEAAGAEVIGAMVGYPIAAEPEPIAPDTAPMFVPLLELEALAPGSYYVNVLAVEPAHRGSGVGTTLLKRAEELGREAGCAGLSLIVSDGNPGARRLYERFGFRAAGMRPMVKEAWVNPGSNWVLLVKRA